MTDYTIVWQDVDDVLSEEDLDEITTFFDSLPAARKTARQDLIISIATQGCPESRCLQWTKFMRQYWAAHLANRMVTPAAGKGTLSGTSRGGVSTTYTMEVNNPDFKEPDATSHYGRQYLSFKGNIRVPMVVGGLGGIQ